MLHKPDTYPHFDNATFIVGSSGGNPERVFTDKASAIEHAADFGFLDFFDKHGLHIAAVKIQDEQDGLDALYFEDEF
jgi:hypothetical protein